MPQLKEKGHVTRGWLGVMIQKVTPDIAESLGLDDAKGALVADVVKEGPAEVAGLKQGDVIVEFDGKPVNDSAELPLLVARTPVGKSVKVKVIRDKEAKNFTIKIARAEGGGRGRGRRQHERGPRPHGADAHPRAGGEPRPRNGVSRASW